MSDNRKMIEQIVEHYLNGEYPSDVERRIQQWLVDGVMSEEKDRALRKQWNKLRVKSDKGSAHASYDKVKRAIGFE